MAQKQHHIRHRSDSSLLVSCLRHSGVLPAPTLAQIRHSSLPDSYTSLPALEGSILVEQGSGTTEDATDRVFSAGSRKGKEKEYVVDAVHDGDAVRPFMTSRQGYNMKGFGAKHECLYESVHIGGSGASFVSRGLAESHFSNGSSSSLKSMSSGYETMNSSHRPFTPPIRPRTSSLVGTQLRPISEGYLANPNLAPPSPFLTRPGAYRHSSTSYESSPGSLSLTPRMLLPQNSLKRPSNLSEDFDVPPRLYNPRHSAESSLLSLGLSTAEKRTISRGMEKDEARAEERAEERRRTVNAKRSSGMTGTGLDDVDVAVDSTSTQGWYRGRKWDYIFNQNQSNSDEGTWPIRDELLDPVEVQAMGALVPLMEMIPHVLGESDDILSAGRFLMDKQHINLAERFGITRTKRPISTTESTMLEEPSLSTPGITGATEPVKNREHTISLDFSVSQETKKNRKPLRHKISSAILSYLGHMKSLSSVEVVDTHTDTNTSSQSDSDLDTSTISLAEGTYNHKSRSHLWRRSRREGRNSHKTPRVDNIKITHPLNHHFELASRQRNLLLKQKSQTHAVPRLVLNVIREKTSRLFMPLKGVSVSKNAAPSDSEGIWNGYSWESEKFRNAGKYVLPGIGNGGLLLDRDFPSPGRTLRKVTKSYASLRNPGVAHAILPTKANVSWTNFLHEFAGTLGNVKESGVRPLSDHCKGSADSLLLTAKAARQSLSIGRSMSSQSRELLTTTEMEEYERDDGEYSYLSSSDGNVSEDEIGKEEVKYANVTEENEKVDEIDHSEGEGEPGSGYSSNLDDGSSADDDEDSKLKTLLHQVGRTYVGYSNGGKMGKYMTRNHDGRKQHKTSQKAPIAFPHNGGYNFAMGNDKTLGCVSPNTGNIRNDILADDGAGGIGTKSTLVPQDIGGIVNKVSKEGCDENTRPRDMMKEKDYTSEEHIIERVATEGGVDQWRVNSEAMTFLMH